MLLSDFVKISFLLYYFNITFVFIMELQYIYVLCLIKSTINTFNRRLKYSFTEGKYQNLSKNGNYYLGNFYSNIYF